MSTLGSARRAAYTFAKYAGDAQAVGRGRIGARIWNRSIWRVFTGLLKSVSR